MQRIKVNDIRNLSERDKFVIDMERLLHTVMLVDKSGEEITLSQYEVLDEDV